MFTLGKNKSKNLILKVKIVVMIEIYFIIISKKFPLL
jgi:hypothetical protein